MQFLLNEFHGKVKEKLWGFQTTYQFANLQSGVVHAIIKKYHGR
jgi:hypothetical protein